MAEPENPIEIEDSQQELGEAPAEASEAEPKSKPAHAGRIERFKSWYGERKKWTIPASVLLFILLLFAIPPTRYALAGTVIKHDLSVKVLDATAGTPVSGASVSLGSQSAETDGTGKAVLHRVKAGH